MIWFLSINNHDLTWTASIKGLGGEPLVCSLYMQERENRRETEKQMREREMKQKHDRMLICHGVCKYVLD